jgi:hypothetical protein
MNTNQLRLKLATMNDIDALDFVKNNTSKCLKVLKGRPDSQTAQRILSIVSDMALATIPNAPEFETIYGALIQAKFENQANGIMFEAMKQAGQLHSKDGDDFILYFQPTSDVLLESLNWDRDILKFIVDNSPLTMEQWSQAVKISVERGSFEKLRILMEQGTFSMDSIYPQVIESLQTNLISGNNRFNTFQTVTNKMPLQPSDRQQLKSDAIANNRLYTAYVLN